MSQISTEADALVIALMHDTADTLARAALADLMDDMAAMASNSVLTDQPLRADHFAEVAGWLRGVSPLSVDAGLLRIGTYGFAFEIPANAYSAWVDSAAWPDLFSDDFVRSIS